MILKAFEPIGHLLAINPTLTYIGFSSLLEVGGLTSSYMWDAAQKMIIQLYQVLDIHTLSYQLLPSAFFVLQLQTQSRLLPPILLLLYRMLHTHHPNVANRQP